MRRAALVVLLSAAPGAIFASPEAPPPTVTPAAVRPAKPPLDFTGVWVLDEKASLNIAPAMRGSVLNVRQTGNEIYISPMDPSKSHLMAEEIVVDGRPYLKTLGNTGKGQLVADWAKDRKSLWLEMTAGPEDNPRQVVQRSHWSLSDDRKTWLRQSVSLQNGKRKESTLVFRRQAHPPTPTP